MAWFKVDDGWWSHPKTLQLSDAAVSLWCRAGSWSCQHLTDGLVPSWALQTLRGKPKVAAELVAVGYWEASPDGWTFHDWDKYQERSDVVKKRRDDARERMRHVRANRTRTDSEGSQEVLSTPTRPDPTRPTSHLSEESHGGTTGGEPPAFCPKHPSGTTGGCRACGDARRAHDAWVRAQKNRPTPIPPRDDVIAPHTHKWVVDGTCMIAGCTERRAVA